MKKLLNFSDLVKLPIDAATETFADLGKKGSGKTYGAKKRFELFFKARVQCVALDGVGNWNGLTSSADGKKPGLKVYVFGGPNGHVPLDPTSGAYVAGVIVKTGVSAILDVSRFRKGERKRFMADFAEEFFHLKKDNPSVVHLFVEEAHMFVPQKPEKGEERMLGAMDDIVRVGRNYGIGASLISQRAAVVNKNVLSQVECLLVYLTTSAHDKKAIRDWIEEHSDAGKELLDEMRTLKKGQGDALFWSPSFLERFVRIKVNKLRSLDTSATPKVGEKRIKAKRRAKVNIAKIAAAMQTFIEQQKENDPVELKKRVKELRAEVERLAKAAEKETAVVTVKKVEVLAFSEKAVKRLERLFDRLDSMRDRMSQAQQAMVSEVGNLRTTIERAVARTMPKAAPAPTKSAAPPKPAKASTNGETKRKERPVQTGAVKLKKGAYEMLQWAAAFGHEGITRAQLATMVAIKQHGSTFSGYLSKIRMAGFIDEQGEVVRATPEGLTYLQGNIPDKPDNTEHLVALWKNRIKKKGARNILDALVEAHPKGLTREELSRVIRDDREVNPNGSTLSGYMSLLRTNGLLRDEGDVAYASDTLFPN